MVGHVLTLTACLLTPHLCSTASSTPTVLTGLLCPLHSERLTSLHKATKRPLPPCQSLLEPAVSCQHTGVQGTEPHGGRDALSCTHNHTTQQTAIICTSRAETPPQRRIRWLNQTQRTTHSTQPPVGQQKHDNINKQQQVEQSMPLKLSLACPCSAAWPESTGRHQTVRGLYRWRSV